MYASPDFAVTFGPLAAGEVKWYKFNFAGTGSFPFSTFLDVDTTTVGMIPASTQSMDTLIGLYDSAGNLIVLQVMMILGKGYTAA